MVSLIQRWSVKLEDGTKKSFSSFTLALDYAKVNYRVVEKIERVV